jgi:preprotein translocase subunit YajC
MFKKFFSFFFLFSASLPLLAEEEETVRNAGSFWQTLIMIAIAIVFFYFILWRPEQKRRKSMEQKRSSMKKGDKITAMGIVGTIDRIKEQTVIVKMVDGSKIEFLKGAITEVKAKEDGSEEEPVDKAQETSSQS